NHKLKQYTIRYLSLLAVVMIMCLQARAQQQERPAIRGRVFVSGKVVSAADGRALEGVTISAATSNNKVVSDKEGEYGIPTFSDDYLTFTFLGFKSVTLPVNGAELINVQLDAGENTLDEVVILGYGETSRRLNTGSVSTISAREIEQQPVTNVLSALSGRMPGVAVQTTNGLPGGNIIIRIRGTGSIAAGTQ